MTGVINLKFQFHSNHSIKPVNFINSSTSTIKWRRHSKRCITRRKTPDRTVGLNGCYRAAVEAHVPDITRDAVRDFLSRQRAYTLHKPARRHFIRNRTYVGKIDKQWQADLADMVGLTRDNGGNRYILTVIDIFSKYAWAVPVKNKDGKSVRDAFKLVLASAEPRTPERLQTDKGKEFFNREFTDLMRNNGIQHFASESDQKAAVVERFNRTLKTRIWTYLSAKRTKKWADVLPAILTVIQRELPP